MRKIVLAILLLSAVQVVAQDITLYKEIVKELSSAKYQGRGTTQSMITGSMPYSTAMSQYLS